MDASSFALFELDAKQCRVGLWGPNSAGEGPAVQELATIAPVLASGPDGGWLHGEAALARRIVAPRACIMDLLEAQDSRSWEERSSIWPFARPLLHPEHGMGWEVDGMLYPRAYLLSRLLVFSRELAEERGQCELRSMALIAGRALTPGLRDDLEQAAKLAGVTRLWWVDRMHALARAMLVHRNEPEKTAHPDQEASMPAKDEQDALSQIDQVLGVAAPVGPSSAQLSHAEFAPSPEQGSAIEKAVEEASSPEIEASDDSLPAIQDEAQSDDETLGPESEELAQEDLEEVDKSQAPVGQWFWVADRLGLELAQLSIEPQVELHSRDLILGVSQLDWQAKVVAQLHEDLAELQELSLNESRLAQVRIWDACGKMMERLESEAQTDLHLPHLCVRKDQSFHYQGTWNRRRMDALIADAVAQLKARCQAAQEPEDESDKSNGPELWQWGRYGSASEMPAFVRVAQQCSSLLRKDAKLPVNSALLGAGIWIEERQGEASRSVVSDVMVGDFEWRHPSGFCKRCETHGETLPLSQDLDLKGAELEPGDDRPWSLYLCLPHALQEQEQRHCVTRVLLSDYANDGRVRIQVQRNARVIVSRSPAAKNAGAMDLVVLDGGLSPEQVLDLQIEQSRRDVDRFMGMRSLAMRKELAKHCADLGNILSERGDKMDDLLRTRLGEWVGMAKEQLAGDFEAYSNKEALASLSPLHEGFLQMVETFSPQQRKSLAIELAEIPELLEVSQDFGMPSGTRPCWDLGALEPRPQAE